MKIRYPKIFKNGLLDYHLMEQDGANSLYSVRYLNNIIGYEVNPWTPQIAFDIDGKLIKKRRNPEDRSTHPEDTFFQSYENALANYNEISNSPGKHTDNIETYDKPAL